MSTPSRSILITSASGNIGQKLIPLLLSTPSTASHTLVLPTRDAARLRSNLALPDSLWDRPNLIVAEGDTSNAPWLESLLRTHAVDTVFSNFAFVEELILTLNLWSACEAAGVKHLIYLSACVDTSLEAVRAGALRNVLAAHVAYKFPAEQRLVYGSPPFSWTILGPSLFFQNDVRVKASLLGEGVYNWSMGSKGMSRVDTADIALGVLRAVEDGGRAWGGKKIMIGSREPYTGERVAKIWSAALGKDVRSVGAGPEDLKRLEEELLPHAGGAWARDLVMMIREFDMDGFGMTEEQYQEQVRFLGKEASSYEEFVRETAAAWKAEA
ncbi:NAD(P)-binding protein [Coniochaeta ligniaria NRRL 30616]|uniref:NAD(P)-binding protein n=1 Tax=Coniochaeta ligniaria NRRL 30616 TaxID=1408157 RepID=A0A1J7JS29_9PEZI|nr:NAD(P)-binding protein [Coniochaeta ligniaria NRRL 30616]